MEILLLKSDQITRQILNILNELTPTKDTTLLGAKRILDNQIKRNHFTYCIYEKNVPIGLGSLVVVEKLSHEGRNVGFIEDIVITAKKRKCGYGKKLIEFLLDKAKHNSCYKCVLSCSMENMDFYNKCGFKHTEVSMRKDFI